MAKSTIDPTKDRDDEDDTGTEDEEDEESTEDEDDDSSDAEDGDEDDDESDEDDEEVDLKALKLTPDQLKYVKSLQGKVTKANAQAATKRRRLNELRKQRQAPAKPPVKRTTSKEPSIAEALAQFKAEQKAERDAERLQSAAERALRTAGLALPEESDAAERKMARALKMLDLDGATPADVADLVADLKDDEPAMFKRVRKPKPRTGGVSGPARTRTGTKAKDAVERALDL